MVTPLGNSDYAYIVMMAVKKKKILLAEAAGTVEKFRKQRDHIITAMRKTSFK